MSEPDISALQFANYQEYNKTLRTWFVTFGLGAPSLFLLNRDLGVALQDSGAAAWVIGFYLLGSVFQVGVAIINKFAAWHAYDALANPQPTKSLRHRCFSKIENEFRIDMAADIVTAFAYLIATAVVFITFAF